ncbi:MULTISPECIES: thermonuclease family protein [unclassified Beijerinckia]|uniref:thermonuclease family protein n=1 Tax=unclassified Beijerinckia TaxID=2638183 RepID=UPI000897DE63|nr:MULTISPECIES: thermonuclease family protein [unclassified Beijerinckia]MDH7798155.1 endonuclease YncB(thermonuclease family) [Beijerinckia sp. GAS462]SED10982.1 Endonuclease YncB, thermonuclease family [Beijerinckia sp. 28-YEA-48]
MLFSTGAANEKLKAAKKWSFALAFVVSCLLDQPSGAQAQGAPAAARDACDRPSGEPVEVADVTAHLELKLADGRIVRIAGIEPARATRDDPRLADKARADLALWTVGSSVALAALDPVPDRWGRVRARAFLAPDTLSLATALIEAGWARVDPLSETGPCLKPLLQAEEGARAARHGLWADPAYALLDQESAQDPDFSGLEGRIAVVSGIVANVNAGRNRTFINLGKNRRKSLTLTVSARNMRAFTAAGLDPKGLTGKTIRARGLIDSRFGPRMELYVPGALEILKEAQSDGWHPPQR